ncbi:fibroblast growth factor 19 [Ictidomys tridecemlineatus]|uniref:Fibroblast growth factor n=1 Tax=Ictidomys tridecemlineatus TaxID=43179 RepID=I3NB92_ICTTR|nr:fibroblast growth factor 19 [Ictidomys tridecemlineatus]
MRSAPSGRALARALVLASLWLAVAGRPLARRSLALSDQGPHLYYGWDQPIRLRHLYAAGPYGFSNCFLRIRTDGAVDCEEKQSERSLMEIRAVALETVAIKDINSVRYLCMGADGRIQGLPRYSEEECTFKEEISYDGYNVYRSQKYHLPVVLSSAKQRQLYQSKGVVPLSYFLPMLPLASAETRDRLESDVFSLPLETDSMDPFGMASEVGLKSPSFQK